MWDKNLATLGIGERERLSAIERFLNLGDDLLDRMVDFIDEIEQQKKLGRFGRGEVFIIELLYELIDSVESGGVTKVKK